MTKHIDDDTDEEREVKSDKKYEPQIMNSDESIIGMFFPGFSLFGKRKKNKNSDYKKY